MIQFAQLVIARSELSNVYIHAGFQLDLEKMPLGKLSKNQIQQAFKVLTTLQDNLTRRGDTIDQRLLISCTNQFFSLIPHDFGVENPPLLDDLEMIKVSVS